MSVHLIKLSVGCESVASKRAWIKQYLAFKATRGLPVEYDHVTRMTPKRLDELLAGGSIYWVIQGVIQARQKLIDIRPFDDADGVKRCQLVMDPTVVPTRPQPRRPFQGWRYLKAEDAPADLAEGDDDASAMSADMQRDLAKLGLL
ncbi:MAG: DUF1489 domain-containing protein [Pseudomonadota bacterium]